MANAGRPKKANNQKKENDVKTTQKIETTVTNEIKNENIIEKVLEQPQTQVQQQIKKKEQRDLNELVCVKNNLHRKLIYPSKIYAGNEFEWGNFGEENYLELRDLVAMRNSYPTYFRECWVTVDDDILEYLGVRKYYEKTINMEDFDDIFEMKIDDLKTLLMELPQSMKDSVAQRAIQLVNDGTIDSMKTIKVLNEVLNIDLSL